MIALFLFACQVEEASTSPSSSTDAQPSEYVIDQSDWEETSALFDLEEIEQQLAEIIPSLRSFNAAPVLASYQDVMSYADSYCPANYEDNGNSFWYGECESDAGMSYNGYLSYNTYDDMNFFGDGGSWDVSVISGATDMLYPEEHRVHWGGATYLAEGTSPDGYPVFFSLLNGSFLDQNQDGWIADGYSSNLMLYGISFDSIQVGAKALSIEGALNTEGTISAVEFNGLLHYPAAIGFPCEEEPLGTIGIRTEAGFWLDLEFDIKEDWSMSGDCDGCGVASHKGEDIGEICIDTSSLVDWEERPWSTY